MIRINYFFPILLFFITIQYACILSNKPKEQGLFHSTTLYEFQSPTSAPEAVIILFGGFPEFAEDIKREFPIEGIAKEKNVALLYMNHNKNLWLKENDYVLLKDSLNQLFQSHKIPTSNIYIGGFSSGGNIALLLGNKLAKEKSSLKPKGIFVIDSPVDLKALYQNSKLNIVKNVSDVSVKESQFLALLIEAEFQEDETNFKARSPYLSNDSSLQNLSHLNEVKIRLYTEPDTLWWKENRGADYQNLNAFSLEKLSTALEEKYGTESVEYITTQKKGYRSNGERHPHSWSIVDVNELMSWIKN